MEIIAGRTLGQKLFVVADTTDADNVDADSVHKTIIYIAQYDPINIIVYALMTTSAGIQPITPS